MSYSHFGLSHSPFPQRPQLFRWKGVNVCENCLVFFEIGFLVGLTPQKRTSACWFLLTLSCATTGEGQIKTLLEDIHVALSCTQENSWNTCEKNESRQGQNWDMAGPCMVSVLYWGQSDSQCVKCKILDMKSSPAVVFVCMFLRCTKVALHDMVRLCLNKKKCSWRNNAFYSS